MASNAKGRAVPSLNGPGVSKDVVSRTPYLRGKLNLAWRTNAGSRPRRIPGDDVRTRLLWLSAAAAARCAPLTQAQTPPPPATPAAAPRAVEGVVVTAPTQQGPRTDIDRRSYGLATDLGATTGSIGDALRNIPSVEVGVQGDITLRGDANVTIMIDGKPSGMFQGESRANALQQLPADQFERVEVITNPSAAFDPNGSAGIINLISKKGRGQGASGAVRINLGDGGRESISVSGAYNSNRLALTGDAGLRRNAQRFGYSDLRTTTDPATGRAIPGLNTSAGKSVAEPATARLAADYDLDPATRLNGEVRVFQVDIHSKAVEQFEIGDAAGGPDHLSSRVGDLKFRVADVQASTGLRRTFAGEGHDLSIDASYEDIKNISRRPYAYVSGLPASGQPYEVYNFDQDQVHNHLKAEYRRPLPGDAKLVAGYQLQSDHNSYDNLGRRGLDAASAPLDPGLTNSFRYGLSVNALYGTYERPMGKLTVLGGLRLEDVAIKTRQVTLGQTDHNDYGRAYPSLHLKYDLGDGRSLTAAYAQRVQRPDPDDLNPFPTYGDALTLRDGNPRLKPQETRSYELAYEYRNGQTLYLATAYFRDNKDTVTSVVHDLGGGLLLTTKENLGRKRDGGLELSANGRLTSSLTYNVSGNAYWTEIDAAGLGFPEARSATTFGGRANLNWQVTPDDFVQVNGVLNARRLTPQGSREPFGGINLGYRRKVDEKLSLVVTVVDALKSMSTREVIDAPGLRERFDRDYSSRAVFIGLTYAFGATKHAKEPTFDFGGGAP